MRKLADILLVLGWIGIMIQIINPFGFQGTELITYPMIIVPIFMISILLRYIKIKPKSKSKSEFKYESNYKNEKVKY